MHAKQWTALNSVLDSAIAEAKRKLSSLFDTQDLFEGKHCLVAIRGLWQTEQDFEAMAHSLLKLRARSLDGVLLQPMIRFEYYN